MESACKETAGKDEMLMSIYKVLLRVCPTTPHNPTRTLTTYATFVGVQRELKSSLYYVHGTPDFVRGVLIHALGL